MKRIFFFWILCAPLLGCCLTPASAADPDRSASPAGQTNRPATSHSLRRWIQFSGFQVATRNKFSQDDLNGSRVVISSLQYQAQIQGSLRIDSRGRYSIAAALGTGSRFNSGWNRTGIGNGAHAYDFHARQLSLDVRLKPWLEISTGGLGFVRNNSTDITSYNNNGYLTGHRISIRKPEQLFFDEVHLLAGYLGDFNDPSVFSRLDRMGHFNYYFLGFKKNLSPHISLSVDSTQHADRQTLRQAVRIQVPGSRFFQEMTFEQYERYHPDTAYGFAWHLDHRFTRRLHLWGGFSAVDQNYGPWNSDRLGRGNRLFFVSSWELLPDITVAVMGTCAFATPYPLLNHRRLDVVLGYNLLHSLHRMRWF